MEDNIEEIEAEKFSFGSFCQEAVSLLLMAYLVILFAMYPFYMQHGYDGIGIAKFQFYRDVTIGAFFLTAPPALVCLVIRFARERRITWNRRMSVTDWAVLAYGICVTVSYYFSQFRQDGLWGEKGWYMGLVTQLLFVLSYFLISRFWEYNEKILYAAMAAAAVVFILGILNRFSVFPFEVYGANNGFLSTLGNINWYCGYWAVLFPVGLILYWAEERLYLRMAGAFCTAVGIATGVSQGSNSAFIVFAGLFILLFCLSFRGGVRMKRFIELLLMFCLVCQGMRLYRIWRPAAFDFYEGALCDRIIMTPLTLYALLPLFLLYLLVIFAIKKKGGDIGHYKMLRQIALLLLTITAGVYIFLLILNTNTEGGIRFMGEISSLKFGKLWGSSRGGTWSAGVSLFKNMSVREKLTGVGPDCFGMYLYTIPDIRKVVMKQFGQSRLTNAHCEWLTVLVNNGIFGLVSYAGIFSSAVIRFIYRAEKPFRTEKGTDGGIKRYLLYLFAASAFAYTIHNIVSFQQILSTPFIFVMLGIGERLIREIKYGQPEKPQAE